MESDIHSLVIEVTEKEIFEFFIAYKRCAEKAMLLTKKDEKDFFVKRICSQLLCFATELYAHSSEACEDMEFLSRAEEEMTARLLHIRNINSGFPGLDVQQRVSD